MFDEPYLAGRGIILYPPPPPYTPPYQSAPALYSLTELNAVNLAAHAREYHYMGFSTGQS